MIPKKRFLLSIFFLLGWNYISNGQEITLGLPIGHTLSINTVKYSPNGKYLVTSSGDGTAKIWEISSGKLIQNLEGHLKSVNAVSFSPNGENVLTTSSDGTSRIWNFANGNLVHTLKGNNEDYSISNYSPDGTRIITLSKDNIVNIWDAATGKLINKLDGHSQKVLVANYSNDGKYIISGSEDKTAIIWDVNKCKVIHTLKGHSKKIYISRFSSDGKMVLTASEDFTVKLWNTENGKLKHTIIGHYSWINDAQFSPDGKYIVTASEDNTAKIWDTKSGRLIHTLENHTFWVNSARYSSDGKYIATASSDHTFCIWETLTGKLIYNIKGHKDWVSSLEFSNDSRYIATASYDRTAKIWNLKSGNLEKSFEGHTINVSSARFSSDENYILVNTDDNIPKVFNLNTGKLLYSLNGHTKKVYLSQFSPNGKFIATASYDNTTKIWESSNGKFLYNLQGKANGFQGGVSQNDNSFFASISDDNKIKIWNASDGALLHNLSGVTGKIQYATISPSCKLVLGIINDGSFAVWDMKTGKLLVRHFIFDGNETLSLANNGLFDATPGAMEKMYWVKGLDVIEFKELKDRYYQPSLWEKEISGEPLRTVRNIGQYKLPPDVILSDIESDVFSVTLTKREGGYGRAELLINNKIVNKNICPKITDTSQSSLTISVNLTDNPWIIPEKENTISVISYSTDGYYQRQSNMISYLPPKYLEQKGPAFYAIVCGISKYADSSLNLNYPVSDALAISNALQIGASNLFGVQNTHIITLTSPGILTPTKENLKSTFEEIRKEAKAEDVFMLYLSGHGITWGNDLPDFHYLTADAYTNSTSKYSDPYIRENFTVSSSELLDWTNAIPAVKTVMILDACGSGKAVENISERATLDDAQKLALNRMNDRAGTFVISGCAANMVSYEASRYGQGLLTYSILEAMKGAALRDGRFVDVMQLANHAVDRVPQLANGIGGIQQPMVLPPKNGSFDIGIIQFADQEKISLTNEKPVLITCILRDALTYTDKLRLEPLLNDKLRGIGQRGLNKPWVFWSVNEASDAYQLAGSYSVNGDVVLISVNMLKNNEVLAKINVTGTVTEKEKLVDRLIQQIREFVK